MPAKRQGFLFNRSTQAHLTQACGHGRELVDFRASVRSFAAEVNDECTRGAKSYRLAVRLLKCPVGEPFKFDDISLRQDAVDRVAQDLAGSGSG